MTSERTPPAGSDSYIRDKYTRDTQAVVNHFSFHERPSISAVCCPPHHMQRSLSPLFAPHASVSRHRTQRLYWPLFFVLRFTYVSIFSNCSWCSHIWPSFLCKVLIAILLAIYNATYSSPRYDKAWSFVMWRTIKTNPFFYVSFRHGTC